MTTRENINITRAISVPANEIDLGVSLNPELQVSASNRDPMHTDSFTGEDIPRLVEEINDHLSGRDIHPLIPGTHEEKKTNRNRRKSMLARLMESAKENLRKTIRVLISAPDVLALSLPALARNWAVLSMIALPPITGAVLLLFHGGGLAAAGCLSAAGTTAALGVFYRYLPMPFATAERWHLIRCHSRGSAEYQELARMWQLERWDQDRWQWKTPRSWFTAFHISSHSFSPPCPCCGTEAEPAQEGASWDTGKPISENRNQIRSTTPVTKMNKAQPELLPEDTGCPKCPQAGDAGSREQQPPGNASEHGEKIRHPLVAWTLGTIGIMWFAIRHPGKSAWIDHSTGEVWVAD